MHPTRYIAAILLALLFTNSSSGSGRSPGPAPSVVTDSPSSTPATSVNVTVDVLSNRHSISTYVYGGSYPQDAATISDSGLSVVRWGGNATSRYNWKTFTNNAAADWYFEDFGYTEIGDGDSTQFIQDVKAAGSTPLMTMVMLPWVAKPSGWSFSVAKYGPQCGADPYNSDAGDGVESDCKTVITGNDPTDANVELRDSPQNGDPPGTVYRNQWAAAMAAAFGNAPHFYNMDNEIDIWSGTHRDVHPNASGYDEMRDTYFAEAGALKSWDPNAIRFGPVSCCWWFYWNGADNNDKGAHAGVDFLPWWLNEVYWRDQLAGTRSVDVFDVHAYPDGPDTSGYTQSQKQALSAANLPRLLGSGVYQRIGLDQSEVDDVHSAEKANSLPHSAYAGDGEHDLSGHAAELHGVERGICGRIGFLHRTGRCRCLRHSGTRTNVSGIAVGGS